MGILTERSPLRLFHYFEEICAIPHGSHDPEAISAYCVDFAKAHGLDWQRDEARNVVIRAPGTPGYEDAPTVILQAHLDMVCEKDAASRHDFLRDPLELAVEGDWIHANGTTLGADDGIGVAMLLAVLEDQTLAHPPLEVLLTTDEEVGMGGARALDCSQLQGRRLVNLDSEEEGVLTVGCVGSMWAEFRVPVSRSVGPGTAVELTVEGLLGGHSGTEIHKGRASANQLMGRLLWRLRKAAPIRLAELEGGSRGNVITSCCRAVITAEEASLEALRSAAENCLADFRREYAASDPGISLGFAPREGVCLPAVPQEETDRLLLLLLHIPFGVQSMSQALPGIVETSANPGVLRLAEEELLLGVSVRSFHDSHKELALARLASLTELAGGHFTVCSSYSAWLYRPDSPLLERMKASFRRCYGREPVVTAIHAGLECAMFCQRMPGLDAVSLGPDIRNAHSPQEKLSLSSAQRTWDYLVEILRTLKD